MLRLRLAMVRIALVGQGNPGPGIDENHRFGGP
jgi:hypothetical protein